MKQSICSDMRYRRTNIRLWIWCIILKCCELPSVSTECLGVNKTVATYPQGTISVQYGNPLEIFCVADGYTSEDVEFIYLGNKTESEKVNETTRRLYIEHPEKQLSIFYCRNKKTTKLCINRVIVDSLPEPVTDFSCISKNLEELNCSWSTSEKFSKVNNTLTFLIGNRRAYPLCTSKKNFGDSKFYCNWNTASSPRYRQYETTQVFDMTTCNTFGCINQTFNIDHYSIVKPDPPLNLKIIYSEPHGAQLIWNVPQSIMDFNIHQFEHIIEYRIGKYDNITNFHRVDTSKLSSTSEIHKFKLNNLPYANTQYEVRVSIKSKTAIDRRYWSDFSYVIFNTTNELPQRPPDMITGAFDEEVVDTKRMMYVYWKGLEEHEKSGENFTYKVLVTEGNETSLTYSDNTDSLNYVIIRNVSLEALNVTVWSVNIVGTSLKSSSLYIPAYIYTQSLRVNSFTKVSCDDGTYELYWKGLNNVDNYTLFWCEHIHTNVCPGPMDFTVIDRDKNSHNLVLPGEHKYQFAISANSGTRSSGMTWASTTFDLSDRFGTHSTLVQLHYDEVGKSSVHLSWRVYCMLRDNVHQYEISYCLLVHPDDLCAKGVDRKQVKLSPQQTDVLIRDLLSSRTYQFTLTVSTLNTQMYVKKITKVTTLPEDIV